MALPAIFHKNVSHRTAVVLILNLFSVDFSKTVENVWFNFPFSPEKTKENYKLNYLLKSVHFFVLEFFPCVMYSIL